MGKRKRYQKARILAYPRDWAIMFTWGTAFGFVLAVIVMGWPNG